MTELCIRPLAANDVAEIAALARLVWHAHYPAIISREQIDFMLDQRYLPEAILASLGDTHWDGARVGRELRGFAQCLAEDAQTWKLDKLYVHPDCQRRGIGRALLQAAAERARAAHARRLVLRVNRRNAKALAAYANYGFKVYGEDVLGIGNGFVMDDYLLELKLCG